MGCTNAKDLFGENNQTLCWKDESVTRTTSSHNYNEVEIDLSHFQISGRTLGLGGFGVVRSVKKITGSDTGVHYAMKSMGKAAILKRSSGPCCVMTELKALVILSDCKFICNLCYAFQDTTHLFMVLEMACGGDMRYNLRATPHSRFVEPLAKLFISQIIIALQYCHHSSILHRDVKPENILMSKSGYLKLSDFGVAKILPNIEECRSTSGTHGYMAPEIYMHDHVHGTPAEWFATGITLHEFVTGRRPFEIHKLQAFRTCNNSNELTLEHLDRCDFLTADCKDFVHRLLCPEWKLRLGAAHGIVSLKQHAWLKNIEWDQLERGQFEMPFVPDLTHPRCEVSDEDARRAMLQQLSAPLLSDDEQLVFKDYEFRTNVRNACSMDSAAQAIGGDHHRMVVPASPSVSNAKECARDMVEAASANISQVQYKEECRHSDSVVANSIPYRRGKKKRLAREEHSVDTAPIQQLPLPGGLRGAEHQVVENFSGGGWAVNWVDNTCDADFALPVNKRRVLL